MAAEKGALVITTALLAAGASVDATNEFGLTPLHCAAIEGSASVAATLIAAGARVDALAFNRRKAPPTVIIGGVRVGPRVDERSNGDANVGTTPLHLAAENNSATVTKVLIDAGAPVNTVSTDGETPLAVVLSNKGLRKKAPKNTLEIIQLLVANGATLPPPQEHANETVASNWEAAAGWAEQRDRGIELTSLPVEVYERGASDIRAYFKSFAHQLPEQAASDADTLVGRAPAVARADYRSKVCVVGPSTWGKTSFIKSFTNGQATLEDADTRTIGIDLFSWAFDVADSQRYHVTLWDFAGQDEYQSAHALFFSRRTLYVLCVNLRANIIKWIRVICAHFPSASFVFVGTKADLIAHNPQVVQAIGDDLRRRLERNEQAIEDAIERERSALRREQQRTSDDDDDVHTRLQTLETLRSQRPRFLSTELLVVSSADLTGMQTLRERLEALIAQSETGFLMPPIYAQVHERLRQQATDAIDAYRSNGDVGALVERTFVSVDALYAQVKQTPTFQSLELDEWTAILHVLHDLGDVLWYDVDPESALTTTVFLSPSVVIDFVRCVVNHTLGRPEHARSKIEAELFALVASEGRVKHKLLERLEML